MESPTSEVFYTFDSIISVVPSPTVPTYCPPPPPNFECGPNGGWVSKGNITTTGPLVIPGVPVVIVGNLNVTSGDIVFNGIPLTLNITGCLTITPGYVVTIDLTQVNPKDVKDKDRKVLILQNPNCNSVSLNNIPIKLKSPKKGCEKISAKTDASSNKSTLAVVFVVDKSGCNTKWIILGAVLGAVLLLAAITTIIVVTCIKQKQMNRRMSRLKSTTP